MDLSIRGVVASAVASLNEIYIGVLLLWINCTWARFDLVSSHLSLLSG